MGRSLPTVVAGGGIGGLAAALAMARTGRPIHLLEQAPEFTEIGAGLQVGPNATRMLDRLGLLDEVLAIAVLPEHGVMRDAVSGARLTTLDLGNTFRSRYGYPYVVLHRSDLLSVLLAACRALPLITLENDKQIVDVRTSAEAAVLTCADGAEYHTELLVGADGIRSQVRTLLDDSPPRDSGFVAFRGTVPMSAVASELADNDVVLWVGPDLHLIQYPIRRGKLYNQVAVIRRTRSGSGSEPALDELHERFRPTCAEVHKHVARITDERHWPIFDRDPLPTWIAQRAVLLGDAAHPMLQYLGQGACQALEDGYVLARELAARPDDVDGALRAYQDHRLPRASRCQLSARPWGEIWHTDDVAMRGLRNRVLQARSPDDYSELDWLYADDLAA